MTGKHKKNRLSHAKDTKSEEGATKRAIPNHHGRFVHTLLIVLSRSVAGGFYGVGPSRLANPKR